MDSMGGTTKSFEDQALDRASKATLLLKNRKDFHDIYVALESGDAASFAKVCAHAGIDDKQLIEDMWAAWLKISAKKTFSAGPIW